MTHHCLDPGVLFFWGVVAVVVLYQNDCFESVPATQFFQSQHNVDTSALWGWGEGVVKCWPEGSWEVQRSRSLEETQPLLLLVPRAAVETQVECLWITSSWGPPTFSFAGTIPSAQLSLQMWPDEQLQGSGLFEALARFLKLNKWQERELELRGLRAALLQPASLSGPEPHCCPGNRS